MFSIEFLHEIRAHELEFIVRHLPAGARILEIGGGTGAQARELAARGYDVVSVDLPASTYSEARVFPIIEYDGTRLPFGDSVFDVVLSSNVLEHVKDLDAMFAEFDRVLKPEGYGVHVMPTGAWRLWTNVAGYADCVQRLLPVLPRLIPRGAARAHLRSVWRALHEVLGLLRAYAVPARHGEVGNALTEIHTFSRRWWLSELARRGFQVERAVPMSLFYTGHMVFGARLSLRQRERLAGMLGSACVLYRFGRRSDRVKHRTGGGVEPWIVHKDR